MNIEATQISAIVTWLSLSTKGMSDVVSVDGVENTGRWIEWWYNGGWCLALEEWSKLQDQDYPAPVEMEIRSTPIFVITLHWYIEKARLYSEMYDISFPPAALAALTEVMGHE